MNMFFLGTLMGSGLVFASREIQMQINNRKVRQLRAALDRRANDGW